jgi:hypothetical protein
VNLNSPAPKIGTLEIGSEIQNGDFLENDSSDFDKVSVTYKDNILK